MKGIEYLIANKLVERNPASVAQFLRSTSSLKKVRQSVVLCRSYVRIYK